MEESTVTECTEERSEEEVMAKSKTLPSRWVEQSGRIEEKSNSEMRVEKEAVSGL